MVSQVGIKTAVFCYDVRTRGCTGDQNFRRGIMTWHSWLGRVHCTNSKGKRARLWLGHGQRAAVDTLPCLLTLYNFNFFGILLLAFVMRVLHSCIWTLMIVCTAIRPCCWSYPGTNTRKSNIVTVACFGKLMSCLNFVTSIYVKSMGGFLAIVSKPWIFLLFVETHLYHSKNSA